jgi:molecular chaperone GrpE
VSKEKLDEELREDDSLDPGEASAEPEEELEPEEKSMEEQLLEAMNESAELRDQILRVAAEFENYKKRMERERSSMLKYAGENIFRELLPVVDNLERATEQGIVEGAACQQNLEGLLEGVQLTLKSLTSTLEKFEVKPIVSLGEPFDPNVQEALTMDESDIVPANHVLSEYEKGYMYKDRLLRAARVVVSSGSADE